MYKSSHLSIFRQLQIHSTLSFLQQQSESVWCMQRAQTYVLCKAHRSLQMAPTLKRCEPSLYSSCPQTLQYCSPSVASEDWQTVQSYTACHQK